MGAFSITNVKEAYAKAQNKLAKMREQGEAMAGTAINTVEAVGTAGALAYLRGRYPSTTVNAQKQTVLTRDLMVAGIPVSLIVGLGGHVAGFAGLLGKYSEHGHAIGTGGLAEYASSQLYTMGDKARVDANKTTPPQGAAGSNTNPLPVPPVAGYFGTQNQQQIGASRPYQASHMGPIGSMF